MKSIEETLAEIDLQIESASDELESIRRHGYGQTTTAATCRGHLACLRQLKEWVLEL